MHECLSLTIKYSFHLSSVQYVVVVKTSEWKQCTHFTFVIWKSEQSISYDSSLNIHKEIIGFPTLCKFNLFLVKPISIECFMKMLIKIDRLAQMCFFPRSLNSYGNVLSNYPLWSGSSEERVFSFRFLFNWSIFILKVWHPLTKEFTIEIGT